MTSNRRSLAAVAIGLSIAAVGCTAHALTTDAAVDRHVDDAATDDYTTCEPYTAEAHDAAVAAGDAHPALWADLMSVGWQGRQDDGMEALWAPECQ